MFPWLVSLLYKYNYFPVHLEKKRKDKIKRQVKLYGGLNFLLRCNYDLKIIERTGMPQCYKAFLQFFHELKSSYETDLGQDLVLFNNKKILTHKTFFLQGVVWERHYPSPHFLKRLVPFSRTVNSS